jgi:deoxyadenosine/deoxycytidine kinase
MKKFVAVAGNIGVGKSTLVTLLSQRLGWEPFYEPVVENPYLPDFYRNMSAWAFHSQMFFLTQRLRAHHRLLAHPTSCIQDRSVYEDAGVFAENLYRQGYIAPRDYRTYRELYEVLVEFLNPPDLVVYLRAAPATLEKRIAGRARPYERAIPLDYLERLNDLYEEWIASFSLCPVLTVPGDDLDWAHHPGHMELMVNKIQEKLTGKDEVLFNVNDIEV